MRKSIFSILIGAALLGCNGSPEGASPLKEAGTMPAIEEGFELGVSACYAATYNDTLYIAGGCNFPDTPASQGGAKRYYKGIYKAAMSDTLQWTEAGKLPATSAYGANIQHGSKLIIAGGMNENGATSAVIIIDLAYGCSIDTLPSLPCTVDNTAGAVSGNKLYVAGGNTDGKPSRRTFVLDLADTSKGWSELTPMPSRARVQPVCAATSTALYVWGGFTPADSCGDAMVHTDGACYNFGENCWRTLPDVTDGATTLTLSGGVAALIDDSTIVAAGGVDREIFTDAISGRYTLIAKEDYMHQPDAWYKFNPRLMQYNTCSDSWTLLHSGEPFARAGAMMTTSGNTIYYVGGELKPGIRTPQIQRYIK